MKVASPIPAAEEFVLLRRRGGLWAAAGAAVHAVERPGAVGAAGRQPAVRTGETVVLRLANGAELEADQVLGMVRGLAVRTLGAVVQTCWAESARGLAVHAGEPCVVIDETAPPQALRFRGLVAREDEG